MKSSIWILSLLWGISLTASAPISESSGSLHGPSEFSKCLMDYVNSTQSHKVSKECAEVHEEIRGMLAVIYGQINKNLNDVLVNKSEVNCLVETFKQHKFLETNILMTTAHLTSGADQEKLLKEVYDQSKMIFTIAAMKCIMSDEMVMEIVTDFSSKVKVDDEEFECIERSLETEEEEARMDGSGDEAREIIDIAEEITTAGSTTELTTLFEEEELTPLEDNKAYETDERLTEQPTTVSNFEEEETEEITSNDDDIETTTHEATSEFTIDPIFEQLGDATPSDDYESTIIDDEANEIIDDITEMSPIDVFADTSYFESSTILDDEESPTEAQTESTITEAAFATDTFIINNEIMKIATPEDSVENLEGSKRVKKSADIPPTPFEEPCESKLQAVRDRIRKFEFTSLDDQQNHCVSENLTEKDLQTIFQYIVLKSASSVEEIEKRNGSLKEMIAASIWNIIECTDLFGFNEIIDALMPSENVGTLTKT